MFCISKTRADSGKLVAFLESAGQIYPETGLTFEAPKCVLPSVIKTTGTLQCQNSGRHKAKKIIPSAPKVQLVSPVAYPSTNHAQCASKAGTDQTTVTVHFISTFPTSDARNEARSWKTNSHWLGTIVTRPLAFCCTEWPRILQPSYIVDTITWNYSVTLKMEAGRSSEKAEHLTTTRCINPKKSIKD
jgi:hypothetical protein